MKRETGDAINCYPGAAPATVSAVTYLKPLDLWIWEGGMFGRDALPRASPETGLSDSMCCGRRLRVAVASIGNLTTPLAFELP